MRSPDAPPQLPGVLLIDDDAISREVLGMMLETHGFPVQLAEDGAQALALLTGSAASGEAPGVILMDTQMPGLSGLELVAALRKSSPARIVAISGSAVSEAIRNATDGFLLKPVEAEAVAKLLAAATRAQNAIKPAMQPAKPKSTRKAKTDAADVASTLIDPVVLGKLKAMMPAAAVREIYAAVASDLKTRLVALEAAIDSDQADEVQRIAHTIKGGCAMVGLSGATQVAARLETSNVAVTWPAEVQELRGALKALEDMLGTEFPA